MFVIFMATVLLSPATAVAQRSGVARTDTFELEIPLEEGFTRVRPPPDADEEPPARPDRDGDYDEQDLDEAPRARDSARSSDSEGRRSVFEWYADEVVSEEDVQEAPRRRPEPGDRREPGRRTPEASKSPAPEAKAPSDSERSSPEDAGEEEADEEREEAAPVIPTLAQRLEPPKGSFADLHSHWRGRREALVELDTAAAESATSALLELRRELGIGSLPGMAIAVVREGRRHLERKDSGDALKSADLAVELAPDLPAVHWFRARALIADNPLQVASVSGAVFSATAAGLGGLPGRRAVFVNLLVILFIAALAAGLLFLALLTTRTIRQYIHDFHHLFPRGAARLQTGVLAVAILVAPILLHAGLAVVIVVFAAAAWFHASLKERVVVALTLALVSAGPHLAGLISSRAAFWDTPSEQVWLLERAGGGTEAAAAVEERAAEGEASWVELFALAGYHKREGRLEKAAELYGSAAEKAPREAAVQNNLGATLYAMNDLAGARAAFRRATELDGALAGAWHNLSKVYFRLGEHVPGQEARRRTADMDASLLDRFPDTEARLNLALHEVRLSSGQIARAGAANEEQARMASEQVKIRLSGLVPVDMAPMVPLAVVPVLILLGLVLSRRRPASPCVKCGRSVCPRCDPEVAGGNLCGQCVNVFQKRGAVSQRDKLIKEAKIRRYQNWREGLARTVNLILPGGGQVLVESPVLGALLLFFFAAGCMGLVLWFGPLPSPWTPAGPDLSRLILSGLVAVTVLVVSNLLLWRRGR